MMAKPWSDEARDYLRAHGSEKKNADLVIDLREKFGIETNPGNLGTYLTDRFDRPIYKKTRPWFIPRALGPPPKITPVGGCLVNCDEHVPAHDHKWLDRQFELCAAWAIRHNVKVGDGVNIESLSRWQKQEIGYEDEQKASRQYKDQLLEIFDIVDWLMGNHCLRIAKTMNWAVSAAKGVCDFLGVEEDDPRLRVRQHRCAILYGCWRAEHTKRTNMIGGTVAHNLCAQHRMNVATAHPHAWGMVADASGRNVALDIGMSANPLKLDYHMRETWGRAQPVQGALILQPDAAGQVHAWHLHPRQTDFEALMALGPHFKKINNELRQPA